MKSIFSIKVLLIAFTLISSLVIKAQPEFSKWYFGQYAGLDFQTPTPTALLNSTMVAPDGCASVSDNSGNILFYSNSNSIFNSQHTIMANGSGLIGSSGSSQACNIVKQPGNNNLYYVFTTDGAGPGGLMAFSIVDMSLAAGLGSVTVKNATLYAGTSEKQVAIRHCNGRDIWILSHTYLGNNFIAYLLTNTGVSSNSVVSSVGISFTQTPNGVGIVGYLKVSPDGKKLGMAAFANSTVNVNQGFYLLDFDPSTGIVSNPLYLTNTNRANGIEFSPDGTKLYGAVGLSGFGAIYQWNLCAPSQSAIVSSQYSTSVSAALGALQRAIDGKIYLTAPIQSLSVINSPNLSGSAMGFSFNVLSIAPNVGLLGLPNFINPYQKIPPAPFTSTIACNSVSFKAANTQSYAGSCSAYSYPPTGYLWDFGEPSSGAANSSTLNNPSHLYSALGTYTVKLILQGPCAGDTLLQTVTVNTLGPNPAVAGPSLICNGDRYTYTVSGGTSYQWSTGSTSSVVTLQPSNTTAYTVTASQNGCSLARVFTVTVNPCLGLEEKTESAFFKFYPNPVEDELIVELAMPFEVKVYDLSGKLLIAENLQSGLNKINTSTLPAGIYILQLSNTTQSHRARVLKME